MSIPADEARRPVQDSSESAPSASPVLFEALPESGDVCALVVTPRHVVREASPGVLHLFGRPASMLVGQDARELLTPLPELPAEGARVAVEVYARRNSVRVPVRLFATRRGDDVTLLIIDLEKANHGAFGQAGAVSRFASLVTHEVRNPLSSVKMVIQTFARAANFDEREKKRLAIAGREVRTIERILSALSELARQTETRLASEDLPAVLSEALQVSGAEFKDREVAVRTWVDPKLPKVVFDPDRLRLALSHLLVNAAHAMRGGGEIRLEAHKTKGGVEIKVGDASPTGAAQAVGAGLSLAMVDKIVREHGGFLTVVASSHGTECTVFVPAARKKKA